MEFSCLGRCMYTKTVTNWKCRCYGLVFNHHFVYGCVYRTMVQIDIPCHLLSGVLCLHCGQTCIGVDHSNNHRHLQGHAQTFQNILETTKFVYKLYVFLLRRQTFESDYTGVCFGSCPYCNPDNCNTDMTTTFSTLCIPTFKERS